MGYADDAVYRRPNGFRRQVNRAAAALAGLVLTPDNTVRLEVGAAEPDKWRLRGDHRDLARRPVPRLPGGPVRHGLAGWRRRLASATNSTPGRPGMRQSRPARAYSEAPDSAPELAEHVLQVATTQEAGPGSARQPLAEAAEQEVISRPPPWPLDLAALGDAQRVPENQEL